MAAVAIAHPWLHPAPQRKSVFRLYRTSEGRWCVRSADGLTGGTFFDHDQAMPVGDVHNRIHLAADPCIVDRDDSPSARCDYGLEFGLVHVERVLADIQKDRFGPAQDERVHCRNKCKIRENHFIARLNIQ